MILPLGSLESHGGHLPFGTDAMTAHLVALDIAARLPKTAVLPPLNYGVSEHYKDFPFTVSVRFETEIAFLTDIFESVYREGIRKVFIMNGHDGNIAPIEVAGRSATAAKGKPPSVWSCSPNCATCRRPPGWFRTCRNTWT